MKKNEILAEIGDGAVAPRRFVEEWVGRALEYIGEEPKYLIPSFQGATDGVKICAIILVSDNLICEVGLTSDLSFDVVRGGNNTRIKMMPFPIVFTDGNGQNTNINGFKVEVLHAFPIKSEIIYLGDDLEPWLKNVFAAFGPHSIV